MDAVIDTSVVVSAMISRRGASNLVMQAAARHVFRMLVTPALFLEYEDVMKRPEHRLATGLTIEDIDRFLRGLASVVVPVDVRFLWRPQLNDPDDEMVLEAAINGRASRIVTFNVKDFRPADKFGVKVRTPQQFLVDLKS